MGNNRRSGPILDGRGEHAEERDQSVLFHSRALVFELKQWINERLKQGGKHAVGYLTIQQIQNYIHNILFTDPNIVAPEVLDMHEARYKSHQLSRMTVLRWVHKVGFKWADSDCFNNRFV